jgi:manganese transport system ATP-binding protein
VDAAVVARGVSIARRRDVAVRDASFDLPSGQVSVLIGPNGSGKSTLLHAIAGLLPVAEGRLEVLGRPPAEVRRRVAYVLQATKVADHLPITVREAVTMGRYASAGAVGRMQAADRAAVDDAIERLELTELRGRHVGELSGGERQRVFVAQGLAQDADLMLLDEPVTGLDIASQQRIAEAVAAERAAGRTVVVSTHDLAEAAAADHLVLMAGEVIATGAPEEVLTTEHLQVAYGGRLLQVADGILVLDDPHHHH